jgi:hypothetical protein
MTSSAPTSTCYACLWTATSATLTGGLRCRALGVALALEEFLRRRGNICATSEALFVHPNTLRQRLRRISELSGIDLRKDDWLMVEIAVKLVRLKQAVAPDAGHTSGTERV